MEFVITCDSIKLGVLPTPTYDDSIFRNYLELYGRVLYLAVFNSGLDPTEYASSCIVMCNKYLST